MKYIYKTKVSNPKRIVCLFHGFMGNKKSIFDIFTEKMADGETLIIARDAVGHNGRDGSKINWLAVKKDWDRYINSLRKRYPRIPIILVGASMGGTIALTIRLTNKNVNQVFAVCALHDLNEDTVNFQQRLRLIFASGKLTINNRLLKKLRMGTPSHYVNKKTYRNNIYLIHSRADKVVPFSNFVKNKKLFNVPKSNCRTFNSGGHYETSRRIETEQYIRKKML